ncbi:hypothetical protein F8388_022731 [Cannabis sativa]|uniref:Zinc knuckle CX2CX4HX4C domain-containing protein n=1 Tax=Cannabis sativa TaxID=3483 RepID=A0A7J6DZ75_CANSA|nr:hypothetical protein F8388_022731 [Cannabis sativa]
MFNVTKPLPRGIPILFPGMASPTWLDLKYEDIPDHCYHCGCLGHSYIGYTEYRRASNESSLPPPLLYKNVLRGTVRPNVNPFGPLLIPNQPRNQSISPSPSQIVHLPNLIVNNMVNVNHPCGQDLQQDFSFQHNVGDYTDTAGLFLSSHTTQTSTLT